MSLEHAEQHKVKFGYKARKSSSHPNLVKEAKEKAIKSRDCFSREAKGSSHHLQMGT